MTAKKERNVKTKLLELKCKVKRTSIFEEKEQNNVTFFNAIFSYEKIIFRRELLCTFLKLNIFFISKTSEIE